MNHFFKQALGALLLSSAVLLLSNCQNSQSNSIESSNSDPTASSDGSAKKVVYPSDVLPFMDQFRILLGDGSTSKNLIGFEDKNFFYTATENATDYIVYKAPNSGVTSKNSSNTRSELHQKKYWKAMEGGNLTGTLKVQQVSTSGDARVAASYSVVVGQIHGADGHENEPIKIFYKKFPGQEKGSVFWNYEINTAGESNAGRWDYSYPVWGYDMSVVGSDPNDYPAEPADGIKLGEEFSYEINVYGGVMTVNFSANGHESKSFTKNLVKSEYTKKSDIPAQTQKLFVPIGQDGVENPNGFAGEDMYFKQGAYNQTNGKDPSKNMVWCTGADVYGGDIQKQYENGDYAEVWFSKATVGPGKKM